MAASCNWVNGDRERPTFSPSINCKDCWHGSYAKGNASMLRRKRITPRSEAGLDAEENDYFASPPEIEDPFEEGNVRM